MIESSEKQLQLQPVTGHSLWWLQGKGEGGVRKEGGGGRKEVEGRGEGGSAYLNHSDMWWAWPP